MTITLTPEIDRALTDFSRVTGESKSAFIVQVLAEAVPHLDRMAVMLQQATKMHGEAYRATRERLAQYADAVTQQAASTLRNADLFLDLSADAVTRGARADAATAGRAAAATARTEERRQASAAAPAVLSVPAIGTSAQPPPVNKGVRNSGKGEGQGSKVLPMRSRK